MPTVDEVVGKYVTLRDRKAEMAARHEAEMAPLNEAATAIENWLMHQLNEQGVESFKTAAGTAFKKTSTSCQMADPVAFKQFVFGPAADGVANYLQQSGYALRTADMDHIAMIIRDLPKWDMVDFRAGKKGIIEYLENEKEAVPGIALNSFATINIRRAS